MNEKPLKTLVVDDEVIACDMLGKFLKREGHEVATLYNGRDALDSVEKFKPDVVVLDVKMPGLDGIQTLKKIRSLDGDCVVVMLTAVDDISVAVNAIENGADSFLRKPVILPELKNTIDQALEKRRLRRENTQYRTDLEKKVSEQAEALREAYARLKSSSVEVVRALAEAIESKDPFLRGHCARVASFSLAMGRELGLSEDQLSALEYGALLHDIGRIGVSTEIMSKPGKLTDEEYELVKRHPALGREIVSRIDFLKPAGEIVLRHHERYDGKGYPDGLGGDELGILVRIVLLADAYDAMTSDRPHRKGMSVERALEILIENRGTQFDPDLVDLFITKEIYNTVA